ncbi:MAG: outer membrane protein assembly factor BamE [Alphaproteobacteria bacterium]|nr:outer membrane protein assembly factor BamE [Alphaproteobacteria bacterium]
MFKIVFCALSVLCLTACGLENYKSSDLPASARLEAIKVGDNKEKVLRVLGTPNYESNAAEGVGDLFFYAEAKKESRIFFDPKVVERDIYVYTFKNNKVSDIQHLTLDDAQKVAYEADTTKVGGKELSVLKQLAENFGRYNPGGHDSTQRR